MIGKHSNLVMVIDSKHALFFCKKDHDQLQKIHSILPEEAEDTHESPQSLGRSFESNSNARHSIEPHTSLQEQKQQKIVSAAIDYLNAEINHNPHQELNIIAPAKILGRIREKLTKQCKKLLKKEIVAEIAQLSDQAIELALRKAKIVY